LLTSTADTTSRALNARYHRYPGVDDHAIPPQTARTLVNYKQILNLFAETATESRIMWWAGHEACTNKLINEPT
jgi:hypothetical protein